MDIGFIVLCPDHKFADLKNSLGSIKRHCYNRECIGVVGNNATADDIKKMKEICPIHKGKETITSLVNVGMKKIKHDWAFIIFGGSRVTPCLERRFISFVKSDKDVLYPVVERKCNFVEGCFNGVLFNTQFFKAVGDLPDAVAEKQNFNDFEIAKLLWSTDAIAQGAQFKGIVGMRII